MILSGEGAAVSMTSELSEASSDAELELAALSDELASAEGGESSCAESVVLLASEEVPVVDAFSDAEFSADIDSDFFSCADEFSLDAASGASSSADAVCAACGFFLA